MRSFLARSEPLSCAGQNGRLASDDLRLSLIDLIIPSVDTCGEVNHQGGSGGHPALDRAPSRSGKRRSGCGSGLWSSPDGFAVFHRPIGSVLQALQWTPDNRRRFRSTRQTQSRNLVWTSELSPGYHSGPKPIYHRTIC